MLLYVFMLFFLHLVAIVTFSPGVVNMILSLLLFLLAMVLLHLFIVL